MFMMVWHERVSALYVSEAITSCPQSFPPHHTGDPVFDELSTAEISLLRDLAQRGSPTSEARLNADALRTLIRRTVYEGRDGAADALAAYAERSVEILGAQPDEAVLRGEVRWPAPAT